MKRAMVGILAVVLLAAFASPVMAISPYAADWKAFATPSTDCGNVAVSKGGTLIAAIDLGATNVDCAAGTATFDVCRVLDGDRFLVVQIFDNNPSNDRISLLEGTKLGVITAGEAFDFLEVRDIDLVDPIDPCEGELRFTSGQPRPAP